jgi:cytochrome P450
VIPAGADALVSPYVTHRHPGHWQDPDRFDPDRFTPERVAVRHRYAWFPFGGGPRSRIGQHLAVLESVLGLATLLRAFEVGDGRHRGAAGSGHHVRSPRTRPDQLTARQRKTELSSLVDKPLAGQVMAAGPAGADA